MEYKFHVELLLCPSTVVLHKICTIFLRLVVDKLIILIVPAIKLTNLSADLL
jgi:hypothetical protein